MAYSSPSGRLPVESASKLGHLKVIESEWVRSLLEDFETTEVYDDGKQDLSVWKDFNLDLSKALKHIWVVDGSYASVIEQKKELTFVKTALMTIEQSKVEKIDKDFPHPLLMQDIMKDSAMFHATVFPLKNIHSSKGNIYDTVRHVIFDSMKEDENGLYFETLKWLTYKKWSDQKPNSPNFECPHCGKKIERGIEYDRDKSTCPYCGEEVLLTDMIGFHLDMNEDSAPDSVASAYMLIMETLMLLTVIRLHWNSKDKNLVSDTLYIKDGPLTLNGQYSKLVPNIREFIQFAKDSGRPIHIMGCEKSGKYFDYLSSVSKYINTDNDAVKYAVLNHGFIRNEIQRAPDRGNPYGLRTNWGEKVFVVIDKNTHLTLNLTTGNYDPSDYFPAKDDVIGLERILCTLPLLISRKYEGALYPVELVNGIASMSYYPSSKILQDFVRDMLK